MQEKSQQSVQEQRQKMREILKKLRQQRLDRKRLRNDRTATGTETAPSNKTAP